MKTYKTAALILLATMTACNGAKAPDLTPSAIEATLKALPNADQIRPFYAAIGWKAAWTGKNAQALQQALDARAKHGLDHARFPALPASGATPAQLDVARTAAALAYAGALSRGLVDPRSLHEVYTIPRPQPDLAAGLAQALRQGQVAQWLDSLAPQDGDYQTLSKAYLDDQKTPASRVPDEIPTDGNAIEAGDADPRISDIVPQLVANGYLEKAPDAGGDQDRYSRTIVDAVKQFQRDFGISDDGVIGPETLEGAQPGTGRPRPRDRRGARAAALAGAHAAADAHRRQYRRRVAELLARRQAG